MARSISADSRIDRTCRALMRAGWVLRRGGKRPAITSPCGKLLFPIPKKVGDSHSVQNWFAAIRRAGVVVPA